eukprot:4016103-Pyramimonas_sp.AAC.1
MCPHIRAAFLIKSTASQYTVFACVQSARRKRLANYNWLSVNQESTQLLLTTAAVAGPIAKLGKVTRYTPRVFRKKWSAPVFGRFAVPGCATSSNELHACRPA